MDQQPGQARLRELAAKYLKGTISESEQKEFDEWFLNKDVDEAEFLVDGPFSEEEHRRLLLNRIEREIGWKKQTVVRRLWPRIAAAAAVLVFLSAGLFFHLRETPKGQQSAADFKNDIAPGGNKAILSLTGGKKIVLSDAKVGSVELHGGVSAEKRNAGLLDYSVASAGGAMVFDTISIPRKGQFTVKLSDGTLVSLNSETRLRFPERFSGDVREVELISGEAYFAVAHNKRVPFRVRLAGQLVEDVGTEFNIKAYGDEPAVVTTLVEGAVRVRSKVSASGGAGPVLSPKPGQEVVWQDGEMKVQEANIAEAVAWKKGDFRFYNTDIYSVMRQLARWYDIEVAFEGKPTNEGFYATVSRSKNISAALRALERTKTVHFRVEGRRVTVLK